MPPQTWKSRDIPEKWRAAQKSCVDLHPDYEYRLWTDADALQFIEVGDKGGQRAQSGTDSSRQGPGSRAASRGSVAPARRQEEARAGQACSPGAAR